MRKNNAMRKQLKYRVVTNKKIGKHLGDHPGGWDVPKEPKNPHTWQKERNRWRRGSREQG